MLFREDTVDFHWDLTNNFLFFLCFVFCCAFQCQFRPQHLSNSNKPSTINGWTRGSYQCLCKMGYYSTRHPDGFNGSIMEVAYEEFRDNSSSYYADSFVCLQCMPGCTNCTGPTPCLATYNWPFR